MLNRFETVIRRCEVCDRETEQEAYYAFKPDLSVKTLTPTTPQKTVTLLADEPKDYNWFIISACKTCGYSYRVTGVPDRKIAGVKSDDAKSIRIKQIELCCDECYNEEYACVVSTRFVMVKGRRIDLCDTHAEEMGAQVKGSGEHSVERRIRSWENAVKNPIAVEAADGKRIIIRADPGMARKAFENIAKGSSEGLKGYNEEITALVSAGLAVRKGIISKRVTLTARGLDVSKQILIS